MVNVISLQKVQTLLKLLARDCQSRANSLLLSEYLKVFFVRAYLCVIKLRKLASSYERK